MSSGGYIPRPPPPLHSLALLILILLILDPTYLVLYSQAVFMFEVLTVILLHATKLRKELGKVSVITTNAKPLQHGERDIQERMTTTSLVDMDLGRRTPEKHVRAIPLTQG